jgi:hypothetical protein
MMRSRNANITYARFAQDLSLVWSDLSLTPLTNKGRPDVVEHSVEVPFQRFVSRLWLEAVYIRIQKEEPSPGPSHQDPWNCMAQGRT